MKKGMEDLAKIRTYSYILFAFLIINIFHPNIANLIHFTRTRMLYSLIMIIVFQIVIMTIYIIKFASQVKPGKYKKVIIMYAARIRYFLIGIIILMGCQVAVCYFNGELIFDKFFVVSEICLLVLELKYLTLLQREQYPDYSPQGGGPGSGQKKKKNAEPEEDDDDKPKSRVGANKARKAAEKKRKSK